MYAPIVLFAYNRPDYLKETITALQKNDLASESELFVFCDGAKKFAPQEELKRIIEVHEEVSAINGFKNVSVEISPTNKGLATSMISGVTKILQHYGSVIVLEDDIVTSPHFLRYMNEGLKRYQHEEQVICIHGYNYPANFKKSIPETFFIKGADCWGWATWKRGWELFNEDASALAQQLEERNLVQEFDFNNSYPYMTMLKEAAVKQHSWAIRWYASAFLQNKLTLYPKESLVMNIGVNGTNSTNEAISLLGDKIKEGKISFFPDTIEENSSAKKQMAAYMKKTFTAAPETTLYKAKRFVKKILGR